MQCICAGRSIDPALVASRQDIGELYRAVSAGKEPPDDLRILRGWRREAAGQAVLDFLAGKLHIELTWSQTLEARTK